MLEDKKTKRGDCEFLYLKNGMACKWMDNWSVLLLSTAIEGMDNVLSVQRREKGSTTKPTIPCSTVVKLYNNGMDGVNLMDQRTAAYQLDCKSSVRFNLRIFFDLLNTACVNSIFVYNMKHPKQLTMFYYKIVIAQNLIRCHQSRQRTVPLSRPSKRKLQVMTTAAIYQSFSQHEKDAPFAQKKGEKIELSLYA